MRKLREEQKERERLEEEQRKLREEEERKKNLVQLECAGSYRFNVEENPQTEEEYNEERTIRNGNGMIISWWRYSSHFVKIIYNVAVTYNGEEYHLGNEFTVHEVCGEENAYEYIFDVLKDDKMMENVKQRLERNIVRQLERHLKNNNMAEMKKLLEENNNFEINFTIETEKTKYM